jgi:galactosamine-6-phosphate isomerase
MLKPEVFPDHETMSQAAVDDIVRQLEQQPDALLCLATGQSPMRAYAMLAARGQAEPRLAERVRILKLDEWGGLAMDDPASSETWLRQALVTPLGLESRYAGFDSRPADPEAECANISRWLQQNGPIDICVLGLGLNGHLGFNEPAAELRPHAHVATLSEASLKHSMVAGQRSRPTCGLTLGMADLLQSRRVLLLVSGASKREPMRRLLRGDITTEFPATFLHLHGNTRLVCDAAAAGLVR